MIDSLNITLIQTDLYWENIDANLAMLEEKIWKIEEPTDLIILPEMFTTGFSMNPQKLAEPANSKTFRWMKQQAAQTKAVVMGSYIVREGIQFFNRLYAVYPDGSANKYDKKHLFTLAGENKDYSPGNKRLILEVKGWKVHPLICYDLRFPVWSRSQKNVDGLYEYDLLVYVANWPKPRIHAWDTLLAARAVENMAFCVGVNRLGTDGVNVPYCGHSSIYDYKGERLEWSENEVIIQRDLKADDLKTFRERFAFQNDADGFEFT